MSIPDLPTSDFTQPALASHLRLETGLEQGHPTLNPTLEAWMHTQSEAQTLLNTWQRLPVTATLQDAETHCTLPVPLYLRVNDAQHMIDMGLGSLPCSCISIPWLGESPPADSIMRVADTPVTLDLDQQLTRFFPTKFVVMLYELQSLFKRLGIRAYLIGGLARDLVLTQEHTLKLRDIDITIEGRADEVAKALVAQSRNFTLKDVYPVFGTAKLCYKGLFSIDMASTRTESYNHCGALPTVLQRGVPLQQDLGRRDFSLNTLALSIHELGTLLDYSHGLHAVEQQELQVLHPATFFEDPSRCMRALKFATRLGCRLSLQTEWLLQQYTLYAHATPFKGGGARVGLALKEWLALAPSPSKHRTLIEWLMSNGLTILWSQLSHYPPSPKHAFSQPPQELHQLASQLATWLEHLHLIEPHTRVLATEGQLLHQHADTTDEDTLEADEAVTLHLSLCYVFHHIFTVYPEHAADMLLRIELTRQQRHMVEAFHGLMMQGPPTPLNPDGSVAHLCEAFEGVPPLAWVAWMMQQPSPQRWLDPFILYLSKWRHIKPLLTGDDICRLGVPAGQTVGACLKALRMARLNKQVVTLHDEELFVHSHFSDAFNIMD
ncbi:MAG: hypothetical protein ACKO34_05670 [Vampirovibrionales bacterium]